MLVAFVRVEQLRHLEMRVAGWRCRRHVIVTNDGVAIEIARTHCSHCPTCRARVAHCERALHGKEFGRESVEGGEYFLLPLPAEKSRDPEAIASYLSEQLQLQVNPA